jgi:hypothetical protein
VGGNFLSTESASWIDSVTNLVNAIKESNLSASITGIGILFAICTLGYAYKAVKSEPKDLTTTDKVLLFAFIIGTVLAITIGPLTAVLVPAEGVAVNTHVTDTTEILTHLKVNSEVTRLIRLIPYTPGSADDLELSRLKRLGPENQEYSFVADYDELRGSNVVQAVKRVGSFLVAGQHVSAIIFPLNHRQLYPANARGLLQIVQLLEARPEARVESFRRLLAVQEFSKDELHNLEPIDPPSVWAWDHYGPRFYHHYCELAESLKCAETKDKYTVLAKIGGINKDYHPLGFSFAKPPDFACDATVVESQCAITNWNSAWQYKETAGVRAFFVENYELSQLDGRIMIDFSNPQTDIIPTLSRLSSN